MSSTFITGRGTAIKQPHLCKVISTLIRVCYETMKAESSVFRV